MEVPFALFRFIGKAALNALPGGGVLADLLPQIAEEAWGWWREGVKDQERQAEFEAIARLTAEETVSTAREVLLELAAPQSAVEEGVTTLITQMPALVRRSLRRPGDPSGVTALPSLLPAGPADVLALLSAAPNRFLRPGDRPLAGADLELVELVGKGGFGEVWKAANPHMPSADPVALKFTLDPSAARTLRNEAAVLDWVMKQGTHPGIVRLQQTYLSADPPCLQYEYVGGGDLSVAVRECQKSGGMPPDQAVGIVRLVAEPVGFAHRLSPPIVHRDLKPANVLVRRAADGRPEYRVTDFGISGVADQSVRRAGVTSSSMLLSATLFGSGTPLYASPQQLRGGAPDPRDDVFALGVMWHQLLTGDLTAGRPGGSKWRHRLAGRGMSAGLLDLLASCIEDDPADRPADAAALGAELGRLLAPKSPPKPVSDLAARLTHKKWDVRRDAVDEAGEKNLRDHASDLAARIRTDDDDDVRLAAFKVLGGWGLATDELFGAMLTVGDEPARLSRIKEAGKGDRRGAAPALAERVRDDGSEAVRLAAFKLLLKWADPPEAVVAPALSNGRPEVRRLAVEAAKAKNLRTLGTALGDRLAAEEVPGLRDAVFECLLDWELVADESLPDRLADPAAAVRLKAVELLKSRNLTGYAQQVAGRLRADQDHEVRSQAFRLLLKWEAVSDDDLPARLTDVASDVRYRAAYTVGKRGLQQYGPTLGERLVDVKEDWEVRVEAAKVLLRWGQIDDDGVRAAIRLAYSDDLQELVAKFLIERKLVRSYAVGA